MAGKGKVFNQRFKAPASVVPKKPEITLEQVQANRKLKFKQSQALLDLDQAEALVLDLLSVCSDTTEQFAALTSKNNESGKDKEPGDKESSIGDTTTSEGTSTDANGSESSSSGAAAQEPWDKIRQNGTHFQQKIKQIHDLLIPHASLVVNYTNNTDKDGVPNGNGNEQNSEESNNGGSGSSSDNKSDDKDANKTATKGAMNMYTSRLEMRLAIERRNLLQDLLRLEKQRRQKSEKSSELALQATEPEGVDGNELKRKRDES